MTSWRGTTVSGCTMARARRHVGNTAAASRKRSRSNVVSLGCGDFLRRITTWCLSIAFSMTSSRRLRTMSAPLRTRRSARRGVPPLSTWRRLSTGPSQRCDAGSSSLTSTTFRVADQRGPPTKFLCCFTRMTMVASTGTTTRIVAKKGRNQRPAWMVRSGPDSQDDLVVKEEIAERVRIWTGWERVLLYAGCKRGCHARVPSSVRMGNAFGTG
jgi:hypothetical protein